MAFASRPITDPADLSERSDPRIPALSRILARIAGPVKENGRAAVVRLWETESSDGYKTDYERRPVRYVEVRVLHQETWTKRYSGRRLMDAAKTFRILAAEIDGTIQNMTATPPAIGEDRPATPEAIQRFADLVQRDQDARLARDFPKLYEMKQAGNGSGAYTVSVKAGPKYTKVDVGDSGRYMVENASGAIYGIKGYGVIHRGHQYGTLDTIEEWDWSPYRATRKAPSIGEDKPEFGKVYALTGPRSIAAGDTWQGSQVFCGGIRKDGRTISHAKALAEVLGCTPHRCGLRDVKAD